MKIRYHFLFAKHKLSTWWTNLQAARKSATPAQPQLAKLPEGIKVIRLNTTRPLSMYNLPCQNCGNNVRTSAAFCPNCGIALTPPRAMPKPTINLQSYATPQINDKVSAIPVSGELDEEVSEIVHIDLMLKVKLYLLWDKAGR